MTVMNAHQPELNPSSQAPRSASCSAPSCHFHVWGGAQTEAFYRGLFKDHADQYEPHRAPDIEVDWEISASCSVCEDSGSIRVDDDGESVRCSDCGTTWSMIGEQGERDA